MDSEIKMLYRKIEDLHFLKPYNSLAKAISVTIEDDELSNELKLEIIKTYINDYYDDLNFISPEEYE